MPYIHPSMRSHIFNNLQPEDPGQLNFLITSICKDYIDRYGESYRTFNDIMGALEGVKLELYRRKVTPYEERKIKQNGDVY